MVHGLVGLHKQRGESYGEGPPVPPIKGAPSTTRQFQIKKIFKTRERVVDLPTSPPSHAPFQKLI